jgi:hypothetical protein
MKPRTMTMAICLPRAQYGPRLPDVRCWIPMPGEEESAGLAFLVRNRICRGGRTRFSVPVERPPYSPLCDSGDAGTFSMGYIQMALHAARYRPVIDASALFAALSFLGLSCVPSLLASYLLLPPTHPRHPPALPSLHLHHPFPAFPRSQTDKNSLLGLSRAGIVTTRRLCRALTSASCACASPSRVSQ